MGFPLGINKFRKKSVKLREWTQTGICTQAKDILKIEVVTKNCKSSQRKHLFTQGRDEDKFDQY